MVTYTQYVVREKTYGKFLGPDRQLHEGLQNARLFTKTGTARNFGKPSQTYMGEWEYGAKRVPAVYELVEVEVMLTDKAVPL